MNTIKTTLHHYCFDLRKPEDTKAWTELQGRLLASGVHCMSAFGSGKETYATRTDSEEIEIETEHLFSDQYNTADGRRVFDWRLITPFPQNAQHFKRGHWVEQTEELKRAKAETLKCGYCGRKYGTWHEKHAKKEDALELGSGRLVCSNCLGSEYLTQKDFSLLTLRTIAEDGNFRLKELTKAEKAELEPLYWEAQNREGEGRKRGAIAKAKVQAEERYQKALKDADQAKVDALTERDGKLWLLERNLKLDPIFYPHTGRWCFGWVQPLPPEVYAPLLEVVSEFPWPYDIKTTDRGTLSAG